MIMSSKQEIVASFFSACSEKPELRQILKTLSDAQIVEKANSLGFEFDMSDLEETLQPEGEDAEISNADLQQVAGGGMINAAVSDGLVCNTIRSLFSGESGCGTIIGGGVASKLEIKAPKRRR